MLLHIITYFGVILLVKLNTVQFLLSYFQSEGMLNDAERDLLAIAKFLFKFSNAVHTCMVTFGILTYACLLSKKKLSCRKQLAHQRHYKRQERSTFGAFMCTSLYKFNRDDGM